MRCPQIETQFLVVAVRILDIVVAPNPRTVNVVVLSRRVCHWADVLRNEVPVTHGRTTDRNRQ